MSNASPASVLRFKTAMTAKLHDDLVPVVFSNCGTSSFKTARTRGSQ